MAALSEVDRQKCMGEEYHPLPPGGSEIGMRVMALMIVLVLIGALSYDVVLTRIGFSGNKTVASPASTSTVTR